MHRVRLPVAPSGNHPEKGATTFSLPRGPIPRPGVRKHFNPCRKGGDHLLICYGGEVTSHWIRNGEPALVLAPMEGVTDFPMRALLSERGGFSHCVSEFLRVSQDAPPAK